MTTIFKSSTDDSDISEPEANLLCSQSIVYGKNACIICQNSEDLLQKVATQTGESMLNVGRKMATQGISIPLNSVPNATDAVADDVYYHLKC